MNKKVRIAIIGGIAVVALVAVIAIIGMMAPKTIDLTKYVSCSFEGYDHFGKAQVRIDFAEAADDFEEELGVSKRSEISSAAITMNECVKVEVESYTDLENGKDFVIKFKIDNTLMKERYNCVLVCDEIVKKVKGLEELLAYNPFDDIRLDYGNNIEYNSLIKAVYTGEYQDTMQNIASVSTAAEDAYNGNSIVVKLRKDAYWFATQGLYVTEFEKAYVLSGMNTYFGLKVEDVEEKGLKDHVAEVKDMIMNANEQVTDVVYRGAMIIEKKNKSGYASKNNQLILAYEVKVTDETGDWSYYYTTTFSDLLKAHNEKIDLADKEYTYLTARKGWFVIYGTGFEQNGVLYAGYRTLEEIYNGNYEDRDFVLADVTIK